MSDIDSEPQIASLPERAALSATVVASPQPVCTVCGRPRGPLKVETCSDRCRAALSRRKREQKQAARERHRLEADLRALRVDCADFEAALERGRQERADLEAALREMAGPCST